MMRCWPMDDKGNCRVCIGKCVWSVHKNTPYIFKYFTETVTKTYAEMKEKFEKAKGEKRTKEKYIDKLSNDMDNLFKDISDMMNEMNHRKTRLKEIVLRPDPLSTVERIDLMICSEKSENHPGFLKRIKMLEEMKRMSLVGEAFERLSKDLKDTKESIISRGRTSSQNRPGRLRLRKAYNWFFS